MHELKQKKLTKLELNKDLSCPNNWGIFTFKNALEIFTLIIVHLTELL